MNDDNAWDGFLGSMNSNQFWISTYTYYGTNNYDQGPFIGGSFNYYAYNAKRDTDGRERLKKRGLLTPTRIHRWVSFSRAYYYNLMSQKYGDLPQSEALQGAAKTAPVYDSQHDIYVQILKWLDDANTELGAMVAAPGSVTLPADRRHLFGQRS